MSPIIIVSTENLPYTEWLKLRRRGIGGSDASVVCGINKWKSPIELWLDKTGQIPHQEAGESAYWGTQLEPFVRAEFTKRTGIEVIPHNKLLQSVEHPFMLANLDGTCIHPDLGECVFEAKTSSAYRISEWEETIPDEYMLQIQHYMSVTGFPGVYVAVLIGGNTFKWYFIERDEELISMLIELESEFWEHVQNGIPPEIDGSEASAKFINEKFPNSLPHSKIALPAKAMEYIQDHIIFSEKVKEFTAQKQLAENRLKQMLGDNEIGETQTHIVLWKSNNKCRRFVIRVLPVSAACRRTGQPD